MFYLRSNTENSSGYKQLSPGLQMQVQELILQGENLFFQIEVIRQIDSFKWDKDTWKKHELLNNQMRNVNASIDRIISENIIKLSKSKNKIQNKQISSADELAKLRKLLNDGVLTQKEFDKKKAQILCL
ncbi:MAG: SHOCT domain-containing protein [Treponema sp.]|nr:SHOCT domain-containing protein [Treponema sp.]